jgi:hypothetical protein
MKFHEVEGEEMVNGQFSIVTCHRRWRFAQSFHKNDTPKAYPKVKNEQ